MSGWVEIGLGVFALVTAFVAPWSWIPAVIGVAAVSLAGDVCVARRPPATSGQAFVATPM